jgi:hypothetical protein
MLCIMFSNRPTSHPRQNGRLVAGIFRTYVCSKSQSVVIKLETAFFLGQTYENSETRCNVSKSIWTLAGIVGIRLTNRKVKVSLEVRWVQMMTVFKTPFYIVFLVTDYKCTSEKCIPCSVFQMYDLLLSFPIN